MLGNALQQWSAPAHRVFDSLHLSHPTKSRERGTQEEGKLFALIVSKMFREKSFHEFDPVFIVKLRAAVSTAVDDFESDR